MWTHIKIHHIYSTLVNLYFATDIFNYRHFDSAPSKTGLRSSTFTTVCYQWIRSSILFHSNNLYSFSSTFCFHCSFLYTYACLLFSFVRYAVSFGICSTSHILFRRHNSVTEYNKISHDFFHYAAKSNHDMQ